MSDLSTILGSRIATSVEINGVYYPADFLTAVIHRFCQPGLMVSPDSDYQISKSGSLLKCTLNERYFVFVTAHQVHREEYKHEQVCLYNDEKQSLSTSSKCILIADRHEDEFDLRLYEFTDAVTAGALSTHGWLNIEEMGTEEQPSDGELFFCVGYPAEVNSISYEPAHYNATAIELSGRSCASSITGRAAFEAFEPLDISARGMSGAPAFSVSCATGVPKLILRGIITDANERKFHYCTSNEMKRFTHALFSDDS